MNVRSFRPDDEAAVIALWHDCGLIRPWNDPTKDIARKSAVADDLFIVGVVEGHTQAIAFYERLGYATDDVVSMGRRLATD